MRSIEFFWKSVLEKKKKIKIFLRPCLILAPPPLSKKKNLENFKKKEGYFPKEIVPSPFERDFSPTLIKFQNCKKNPKNFIQRSFYPLSKNAPRKLQEKIKGKSLLEKKNKNTPNKIMGKMLKKGKKYKW